MSVNNIIFDLDGTLLNTLDDLHISFNYALKKCGYSTYSIDDVKSFVGNGIKKAFERALGNQYNEVEIIKLIDIFKEHYQNQMNIHTKAYFGIINMLQILKDKNFKIAVVSNKYDIAVKELCKKYFNGYIDAAVGESQYVKKKPSIDGILAVCKILDIKLNNTIYVGDSEVDINTAKNANIPCISVLWGFKDKNFLIKNGGNIFADTPDDIIKIVEKKLYLI